jgi:hypothetical protein
MSWNTAHGVRIVGMHLGCELRGKTIEEGRYAIVVPCISCPLGLFAKVVGCGSLVCETSVVLEVSE